MSGEDGVSGEPRQPGADLAPRLPHLQPVPHHHAPAQPGRVVPFLPPPPAYPLPLQPRAAGEGKDSGAAGGRPRRGCRSGSPRQWVKVREETAGATGNDRSQDWREGGPSESSHTLASAGTSYWMYCFLHSGVMCAERCSANFILPFPLHSHPGPAVTGGGGGGGGGNSDSDSSPHGPRRGAALLSSSAAAEVSLERPSRHLPPPLHSPAPPRPLDVIAMVTAYAVPTKGGRVEGGA